MTEKIQDAQNINNFGFVQFANSSQIVTLSQSGTIEAGDTIRGLLSNATANVASITISPVLRAFNSIQPGEEYGFIYDLTEYL